MKNVDHIGIAVRSIEKTLPFYTKILGFSCLGIEEVESEQVRVAFIAVNNVKIELLEPIHETSTIAAFIAKRGEGVHHIAFGVTAIEERIAELKENGIQMIQEKPKQGAGGSQVVFLHPKSTYGVLYELLQTAEETTSGRYV